ncbi:hypothetical protein ABN16_00915 [Levilactobacillus koreensis]|uniref:Uncharacterized protein n=1 Tax=Levilactobacillus koreensis TaxID=637971 RepID=A0AAC8UUJ3_9LACO|nr:hypothetical protein ABN16_00915 [Levilactobacillus koreensis]
MFAAFLFLLGEMGELTGRSEMTPAVGTLQPKDGLLTRFEATQKSCVFKVAHAIITAGSVPDLLRLKLVFLAIVVE